MSTAMSGFLEVKLLGHTLLGSSYTAPTSLWLALCTTITTDANSLADITEVTTNVAYTRQPLSGKLSAPTSGPNWTCVTSETITWSAATSAWNLVGYVTVMTSATIGSGDCLYWGALDTSRQVITNDIVQFSAGAFWLRLS